MAVAGGIEGSGSSSFQRYGAVFVSTFSRHTWEGSRLESVDVQIDNKAGASTQSAVINISRAPAGKATTTRHPVTHERSCWSPKAQALDLIASTTRNIETSKRGTWPH